jgi:NTE family protein
MNRFHNTSMRYLIFFLFLLNFCFANTLQAQDAPKVGVVLSGGGAKGYAHVGALKVLEEAGVHIDYIAGTSMGAIVGGLYAAGYSADQLDSILRNTDIADLMNDKVPRSMKPIFEKEYGEKYALSLTFEDFKIFLPSALSNGQNIFNFLNRLTFPVAHIRDFSQLSIPFFCVGTNVATGEAVYFENGSLAAAMRASGAFPGLLAPFRMGDKLITDGGIVDNFPARKLFEKGVDIIIGVNVEQGLYGQEDLFTIDKIIEQVSSFQMVQNSEDQLQYCDVLIRPKIDGFSVTSFDAIDTLIKSGEMAAREYLDTLKSIASNQGVEVFKSVYLKVPDTIQFESYNIAKNRVLDSDIIAEYFPKKLKDPFASDDFYKSITHLYGTGCYQYIDYDFLQDEDGCMSLEMRPYPKQGYDRLLRLGLHFDDVYKSSLLLNLTFLNLGFRNSTASLNLILGDEFRYSFNYLWDLAAKPDLGVNSYLFFNHIPSERFSNIIIDSTLVLSNITFDQTDFTNEMYVRLSAGNFHSFNLGGQLKYFKSSSSQVVNLNNDEKYVVENGLYSTGFLSFHWDSRDYRVFPTSGTNATLMSRATWPLETEIFEEREKRLGINFDLNLETYVPLNGRFTLGFQANVGLTYGEPAPPFYYFLGGNNRNYINNFKPFIGLPFASEVGTNLLSGQLYGQQRIFKSHFLYGSINYAYISNELDATEFFQESIRSFGIGYGLRTGLGPIALTYGYSNEGDELYLVLGYWF